MTNTIDRTDLEALDISGLDTNLADDVASESMDGYALYWAAEFDDGFRTGNGMQVLYAAGRAGLVYCGSGSSGMTSWTDCSSAEDALRRYLDDDMRA